MNLSIAIIDQAVYGVALLLGLAICFFGYQLFRFWLMAAGLQAGFYLGLWLGNQVLRNEVMIWVIAILCGILVAGLSYVLVKIGAFIAGAAILVLLAALVLQLFGAPMNLYVLLIALLAGGLLGVFTVRPYLILATAANGAFLIADSIANLIAGHPLSKFFDVHKQMKTGVLALLLTGLIVLSILGAMVQFHFARKKAKAAPIAAGAPSFANPDAKENSAAENSPTDQSKS